MKEKLELDGKFELDNGYYITRVVYCSMGKNFIPYIVGCLVVGPKGGIYVLDTYSMGKIVHHYKIKVQCGIHCRLLDENDKVKVESKCVIANMRAKTNEEEASMYAQEHEYSFIKRTHATQFLSRVTRDSKQ